MNKDNCYPSRVDVLFETSVLIRPRSCMWITKAYIGLEMLSLDNFLVQRVLLERPRLVSDHFYLATSITSPNQNEAEDIGHLKYML